MGFDPISIGLMVAGTAVSAYGQYKTMQSQQQQLRARQAMSNLQSQNERLDQVRQGRIKQAQILQMGENQGAGESSSVTTGMSGVQGQVESNIGYINNQQSVSNSIFSAQRSEVSSRGITSLGGDIKEMGATLFDPDVQAGIKNTYNNIFGD